MRVAAHGMAARAVSGREWAIREALPLWSGAGFDPADSLFRERLDFAGAPIAAPRRLTTQARQIYVLAHAALLGWHPQGRTQALAAAHAMTGAYLSPDGRPGWAFSIGQDGRPADARRELYAHAFALFGLAWAWRLDPDPRFAVARDATLALLDGPFAGAGGGYLSYLGDDGAERLQNPHMHLLEAMLAWYDATGDAAYLERARAIGALFMTTFFQPDTSALPEYFGAGWTRLGGERGTLVEPGHHFEWAWLLHRLQVTAGLVTEAVARPLYDHACRFGHDAAGLIVDCLREDGTLVTASRRTWPHTEAIKAHAAAFEQGDEQAEDRAARVWDLMFAQFLSGAAAGGWRDHLDASGAPLHGYMPATTLYHVFCAIAEANRVWPS
ncbi:MAG: AGE family epimerase/isomerase [Micropepsaceae bacterium]